MSSEYEFLKKDRIKLYLLNEAVDGGTVSFRLFLESGNAEMDFLDIRASGGAYRFNNFSVSEDADANCITFCPTVIGCYVYFSIAVKNPVRVEIIRNGTDAVAETFDLGCGLSKLEFLPQGVKNYVLKVSLSQPSPVLTEKVRKREYAINQLEKINALLQKDVDDLEARRVELERKNHELADKKRSLTSHLDRLQEEFDKDYAEFGAEAAEISARYKIDSEILRLYADKEVVPIEELLGKAEDDVRQVEEQIRVFVEAQERKTAEIERELKIGNIGKD